MGLIKITFDSASVTSKQDADLNHFLANKQNGRVSGVLNGVTPSTSNNYISFTSGYVQVYGRRVYVEPGTKIAISLDGSAYGYIYIAFDLSNNTATLNKRENASSYPTLTQEDLMNGGYLYELPIARYTKTSSSLTLDSSYTAPYIKTAETIATEKANNVLNTCASRYGSVYQGTGVVSYGTSYKFTSITTSNALNGMGSVYINGCTVLFNTDSISGSGGVVYYYYNGQKSLSMQLTSGGLYIQSSEGSEPKYVRIVR